jgi:phage-related protein
MVRERPRDRSDAVNAVFTVYIDIDIILLWINRFRSQQLSSVLLWMICESFQEALGARLVSSWTRYRTGEDADDWKPMPTVGNGVHEIRVRDEAGAFRLMYVAKFPEAVYVLHAFQKKTRTTARRDLALGKERYQEVLMRRKSL